jgi:hypothetical protein
MHEELNPITRLQPKMFTDRFRDGGLALDGDGRFHLSLHYILTNVIPRLQSARQAGNSPKVLHLSGLVHGLLSVARLLSLRAMILLTLRAIEIVVLGSQERHTARTLPEAQIMDSSTDCGEDD